MPYPFNYFASIFNFRSSFANRKKLSWFQMIFTSFFLISITLLPVALQNAQLKTYPLTTFVSDVFDPLSTDVMKDIQEHVVIKDQELTYTGTNPVHKTSKGQVILGQEAKASEGKELTLHFDRKQSHTRLLIKRAFGIKKASLKLSLAIGFATIDSLSVSFS